MKDKADRDKAAKSRTDAGRSSLANSVSQPHSLIGDVNSTVEDDLDEAVCFGAFILRPKKRSLIEGGKPVQIGSRAFDILCLLVERAGQFLGKDEILARAWPATYVADANVRVQVAELRRALGDGHNGRRFIVSAPNRGYSFVETVHRGVDRPPVRPAGSANRPVSRSVPALHGRIIGRAQATQALMKQILQRRLVTVVGTGGVGKTTLVVSTVSQLLDYPEPIKWRKACFVDLASLSDARVVPSAFASALGVALVNDDAISSLVHHVRDEEWLIVIDNCEHVIGAVVDIVEAILRDAPGVDILATSREPLRVEDEWVHRLQPLAMPPESVVLTLDEAISYPAIELFIERARARSGGYEFRADDIKHVVDICRRLDGIPLALELAAARFDSFGASGLAAALDDLFAILTKGRRKALPRQQTLHSTLDWSFNLLNARDRMLLRRLAVFAGGFTLERASAVATSAELSASDVLEGISDLVAQSLLTADMRSDEPSFALLETTRAYAREKLAAAPEADEVARRHADLCHELLAEADEWDDEDSTSPPDKHGALLDDLRTALKWAFRPAGDLKRGVSLTVAAVPLWLRLSLVNECRERVEDALGKNRSNGTFDESSAMKLEAARAWSLMYTSGMAHGTGAAWTQAHGLAEHLGDDDYRLRSLWGLWAAQMKSADFPAAHEAAARFKQVAQQAGDADGYVIGDRLLGTSLHFLGDQTGARLHIERMLGNYKPPRHRLHIARYQVAPHIAALMTLSRVLWVQGYADQAMRMAEDSIEAARALDHRLSLCYTLAQSACPIALLNGDLERAECLIDVLFEETARHRLDVWHIYASAYRGQLLLLQGDIQRGLPLIQAAVDDLRNARFMQHYSAFIVALADGLVLAGRWDAANTLVNDALVHSERTGDRWIMPEMLRLKGEIAILLHDKRTGEAYLVRALKLAQEQKALAWQRRAVISLSRSLQAKSRNSEARELLASLHAQITEGFETRDHKIAQQMFYELT